MPPTIRTAYTPGSNLAVSAVRAADGHAWDDTNGTFAATVADGDALVAMTEGSGRDAGSYSAEFAAGMGTADLIVKIHDTADGNRVLATSEVGVLLGVELYPGEDVLAGLDTRTLAIESALGDLAGDVDTIGTSTEEIKTNVAVTAAASVTAIDFYGKTLEARVDRNIVFGDEYSRENGNAIGPFVPPADSFVDWGSLDGVTLTTSVRVPPAASFQTLRTDVEPGGVLLLQNAEAFAVDLDRTNSPLYNGLNAVSSATTRAAIYIVIRKADWEAYTGRVEGDFNFDVEGSGGGLDRVTLVLGRAGMPVVVDYGREGQTVGA